MVSHNCCGPSHTHPAPQTHVHIVSCLLRKSAPKNDKERELRRQPKERCFLFDTSTRIDCCGYVIWLLLAFKVNKILSDDERSRNLCQLKVFHPHSRWRRFINLYSAPKVSEWSVSRQVNFFVLQNCITMTRKDITLLAIGCSRNHNTLYLSISF